MSEPFTVFAVDDDAVELEITKRWCSAAQIHIVAFESARQFLLHLEEVESTQLGCVVSDLRMPEMSGIELLTAVQDSQCSLPVILLTGLSDVGACRDALKAGAFDFVEKGYSSTALLDSISRAADESRRRVDRHQHRAQIISKIKSLSPKERQVAELLVNGLDLKQISDQLEITPQTASKHRIRIYNKIEVENDVALARLLAEFIGQED